KAPHEMILRVPGVGVRGAQRIVTARRVGPLTFEGVKRLGIVMKRAQYFIICSGHFLPGLKCGQETVYRRLAGLEREALPPAGFEQLTLFDSAAS
ncbi:MAG: hypothetical protein J6C43_01155, partial [Oscillospiraceae bacterium]|nr:hypothetical protein [Oscillospiraceae bacterium]